jgi:pseudouridine-5'-phosphate glycosidase
MNPERFQLSSEVGEALARKGPVVALETSVLAHGLPPPRNREAARLIERAIRAANVVPAWVAVDGGRVHVGLEPADIERLTDPQADIVKVARRDIPAILARGARSGRGPAPGGLGATTVSATLWAAARAGIRVMATGGIGGVHPGTGDVSADLAEMGRLPGLIICSGPKSIVDPTATIERLEELGVLVVGYRCSRLPFFLAIDAGVPLEHRVDGPAEAAEIVRAREAVGVESAILLCNPVPTVHALDRGTVARAVQMGEQRAVAAGVRGKDVTPFLLGCVAEITAGASLEANLALLESNAGVAAAVAKALHVGAGLQPGPAA